MASSTRHSLESPNPAINKLLSRSRSAVDKNISTTEQSLDSTILSSTIPLADLISSPTRSSRSIIPAAADSSVRPPFTSKSPGRKITSTELSADRDAAQAEFDRKMKSRPKFQLKSPKRPVELASTVASRAASKVGQYRQESNQSRSNNPTAAADIAAMNTRLFRLDEERFQLRHSELQAKINYEKRENLLENPNGIGIYSNFDQKNEIMNNDIGDDNQMKFNENQWEYYIKSLKHRKFIKSFIEYSIDNSEKLKQFQYSMNQIINNNNNEDNINNNNNKTMKEENNQNDMRIISFTNLIEQRIKYEENLLIHSDPELKLLKSQFNYNQEQLDNSMDNNNKEYNKYIIKYNRILEKYTTTINNNNNNNNNSINSLFTIEFLNQLIMNEIQNGIDIKIRLIQIESEELYIIKQWELLKLKNVNNNKQQQDTIVEPIKMIINNNNNNNININNNNENNKIINDNNQLLLSSIELQLNHEFNQWNELLNTYMNKNINKLCKLELQWNQYKNNLIINKQNDNNEKYKNSIELINKIQFNQLELKSNQLELNNSIKQLNNEFTNEFQQIHHILNNNNINNSNMNEYNKKQYNEYLNEIQLNYDQKLNEYKKSHKNELNDLNENKSNEFNQLKEEYELEKSKLQHELLLKSQYQNQNQNNSINPINILRSIIIPPIQYRVESDPIIQSLQIGETVKKISTKGKSRETRLFIQRILHIGTDLLSIQEQQREQNKKKNINNNNTNTTTNNNKSNSPTSITGNTNHLISELRYHWALCWESRRYSSHESRILLLDCTIIKGNSEGNFLKSSINHQYNPLECFTIYQNGIRQLSIQCKNSIDSQRWIDTIRRCMIENIEKLRLNNYDPFCLLELNKSIQLAYREKKQLLSGEYNGNNDDNEEEEKYKSKHKFNQIL